MDAILVALCVALAMVPLWTILLGKEHSKTRNLATCGATPHPQAGVGRVTRLYGESGAYQDAVLHWRSQPVGSSVLAPANGAARMHARTSSGVWA